MRETPRQEAELDAEEVELDAEEVELDAEEVELDAEKALLKLMCLTRWEVPRVFRVGF